MSSRIGVKRQRRAGYGTQGRAMASSARVGALRARARGFMAANRPRPQPILRQLANVQKGGMDTDVSLSPVISTTSTNASSFILNLVQQGAGSWNRVGRKIIPKSLRIKGVVQFTLTPTIATGALDGNLLRMVVVHDKQPSGATLATFDAIFGITVQDGTESCPDVTCPPRYDNMDRFKVLMDRTIAIENCFVSSLGSGPNTQLEYNLDEYMKLNCGETVYSGQSNPMTIADISTGAIIVYFRARNNTASNAAAIDAVARLRYV